MTEQSDSNAGPDTSSSDTDLPIKRVDSANENGSPGNAAGLDTSDDTQPPSDTFEQQIFYKRELRPLREPKRTAPNTWVDADTTGDFDPHEEARQARLRRKKAKLSHRKKIDWISEGHTHDPDNDINLTAQPRPPLRLTFSTSSGKAAFSELDAKFQREVKPARDHFTAGYQLRKRNSTSGGSNLDIIGAKATGVCLVAPEPRCDYSNHPVARGCVACLALARECSLLRNEHAWPCDECEEDDNDCQLVQEPELKMACTHCQYLKEKKKWLVCSFEYSHDPADHRGRCERCNQEDHKSCIAGPRPGHTRTRIRIAPDGTPYKNQVTAGEKAPQVSTCKRCLNSQRVCSFASRSLRSAQDVCTACDMSGESCEPLGLKKTGIRVPQQQSTNSSAEALSGLDPSEETITLSSSPPQTPKSDEFCRRSEHSPDESASPPDDIGGSLKTVRTRFCHPMHFDYQDKTPDDSDPCHFCSCVHFAILGLEARTVDVIDWHDGRGWEETGGGHGGDDIKGTQVCSRCTLTRMQIMVCNDHALRRITELGTAADLQEALIRLLDPDQAADDQWCSVCCNLAAWECCEGVGEGCGLALCEQCVTDLGKCGGSLETMLQALVDEPSEARPAGLRADYELLKDDGLLMRYLNWAATK